MSKQTPLGRVLFVHGYIPVVLALLGVASILFINVHGPKLAYAAPADTVNFQARLQTGSGAIAPDGTYNVEFKLYSATTGGTALWTEDYLVGAGHGLVTVNGYLSANLGSITPFPNTIDWSQQLYLTMNIGGTDSSVVASSSSTSGWDGEMSPRLALTATPYAFQAENAQTAQSAQTAVSATQAGELASINGSNTATLSIQAPTSGNQTFVIQDQGAAGTYDLLTTAKANNSYVQLQSGTLTQQTGSIDISGSVAAGSISTASIDTANNQNLEIGQTNATGVDIGNTGENNLTTIYGSGLVKSTAGYNTTSAFQVQASGSSTAILDVDTSHGSVGVNTNTPAYALDVNGVINSNTSVDVNGVAVCTTACLPSGGSGNYIQNSTTVQNGANIFVRSVGAGSPVTILQGAVGQTADLLDLQTWNGTSATTVGAFDASGDLTITGTGTANALLSNSLDTISSGGTLNIGSTHASTVNVGANTAAASTTTVGSGFGSSTTTLQGGAGGLSLLTGAASSGNSGSIIIQTGASSSGISGNISIDNGSGTYSTGTTAYSNTFEASTCSTDATGFTNWYGIDTAHGGSIVGSSAQAYAGSCSMAVTEASDDTGFWAITGPSFTVVAGQAYTFTVYAKAGSLAQSIEFQVQWSNGVYAGITSGLDTTTGWTKYTGSLVVPAGVTSADVILGSDTGNHSSTTYFDNVTAIGESGAPAIDIGTSNAQTINIGNTSEHGSTLLQGGSGGIDLSAATNASVTIGTDNANAITIGNTTNTNALTMQGYGISDTITGSASAPSDTIKTTTNSSTAFQIQNAAGTNLMSVDTAGNNINVGATGSTALSSTISIATSTAASYIQGVSIGSSSNTADTVSIQGGGSSEMVSSSGFNFQASVQANSNAFLFQGNGTLGTGQTGSVGTFFSNTTSQVSALTAIGKAGQPAATNIFSVQSVSGSTYSNLFTINTNGNATFSGLTDSSSAFQIQDTEGMSLFNVDTYNYNVNIGDSMSLNGISDPKAPTLASASTGGSLTAGTYSYSVSAVDADNLETAAIAALTSGGATSVTTTGSTSENTITWTAVSGAKYYYLYRYTSGSWKVLGELPSTVTSVVDTSATSVTVGGSSYTWGTSTGGPTTGKPNTTGNWTTALYMQQGAPVVFNGGSGSGNAMINYSPNNGNLVMQNPDGTVVTQGTSFEFQDTNYYYDDFSVNDSSVTVGDGSSGDPTAEILTLDNQTGSTAPTEANGAMYYDANTQSFRCGQSGAWVSCTGQVFENYGTSSSLGYATKGTPTALGAQYTVPLNDCEPGVSYSIHASGHATAAATTDSIRFYVQESTNNLMQTGLMSPASTSQVVWTLDAEVDCVSKTSVDASGNVIMNVSSGNSSTTSPSAAISAMGNAGTAVTWTNTGTPALGIDANWGSSNSTSGDALYLDTITIQRHGP